MYAAPWPRRSCSRNNRSLQRASTADGIAPASVDQRSAREQCAEVFIGWRSGRTQGTIAAVNELEEGTRLALDFGKLASVAATGARVVPVVLQDADSGEVLFIGYANEEALETSLRERIAVLWSTSRNKLWRKGATSGDVLELAEIRVNCEQNSVLYLVRRTTGGACHTLSDSGSARPSCYYRVITDGMTLLSA
jgi:phosphoribosyl-AMP cyclohydrolase